MSDTPTQFANYCGWPVIVEETYTHDGTTYATISYEDGREQEVPYSSLDLVD